MLYYKREHLLSDSKTASASETCTKVCYNGGTCHNNTMACLCADGWYGDQCERCFNRIRLVQLWFCRTIYDGTFQFVCSCLSTPRHTQYTFIAKAKQSILSASLNDRVIMSVTIKFFFRLTEFNGTIYDGPFNHTRNQRCIWMLDGLHDADEVADSPKFIRLTVQHFQVKRIWKLFNRVLWEWFAFHGEITLCINLISIFVRLGWTGKCGNGNTNIQYCVAKMDWFFPLQIQI